MLSIYFLRRTLLQSVLARFRMPKERANLWRFDENFKQIILSNLINSHSKLIWGGAHNMRGPLYFVPFWLEMPGRIFGPLNLCFSLCLCLCLCLCPCLCLSVICISGVGEAPSKLKHLPKGRTPRAQLPHGLLIFTNSALLIYYHF